MNTSTNNKTAVVTGGSGGIGLAIAKRLLQENYKIVIIARDNARLQKVVSELQASFTQDSVSGYCANLGNAPEAFAAINFAAEKLQTIRVLVNNAGLTRHVNIETPFDQALQLWQETISGNLDSAFFTSMAAIPKLENGGRIINLSSIAAQEGSAYAGAISYSAAKAGVDGLTLSLARELGKRQITVNAIAPGYIDQTNFFNNKIPAEQKAIFAEKTAVGRNGTPKDIAEAVCWLASDEAAFITGTIIPINGGARVG